MGQKHGEYEPNDSRNVTGTVSMSDLRWTRDLKPPRADRFDPGPRDEDDLFEDDEDDEGETISFEPDPELQRELDRAGQFRVRPSPD